MAIIIMLCARKKLLHSLGSVPASSQYGGDMSVGGCTRAQWEEAELKNQNAQAVPAPKDLSVEAMTPW